MTDKQITVPSQWRPSPAQERVATYLARGLSKAKAGAACNVAWRTVQQWTDEQPEYCAYVDALRAEILGNQAVRFASLLDKWQGILDEVADGSRSPKDPLARHAQQQLSQTLYRVYVARAGSPGS